MPRTYRPTLHRRSAASPPAAQRRTAQPPALVTLDQLRNNYLRPPMSSYLPCADPIMRGRYTPVYAETVDTETARATATDLVKSSLLVHRAPRSEIDDIVRACAPAIEGTAAASRLLYRGASMKMAKVRVSIYRDEDPHSADHQPLIVIFTPTTDRRGKSIATTTASVLCLDRGQYAFTAQCRVEGHEHPANFAAVPPLPATPRGRYHDPPEDTLTAEITKRLLALSMWVPSAASHRLAPLQKMPRCGSPRLLP